MNYEIGSEFWDVPVCDRNNTIFPDNTQWYLSGRSALIAIINDIKTKISFNSVALPSWCCHSMILPFLNANIIVKFYSVFFKNGQLKYDFSKTNNCDVMLIMDYFGYIRTIKHNFKGLIINDITHSVFSDRIHKADYVFGSLRKWAGFYTGGFAYKNDGSILESMESPLNEGYVSVRKLAMEKKSDYINGKIDNKDFLSDFSLAEDILDTYQCAKASDFDIMRAKKLDVDFIKQKRRENASVLIDAFSHITMFPKLNNEDCPLFVPLLIPDGKRENLRKFLVEKKVYCPVHWCISEYHILNKKEAEIYNNELSIVCDQRYDKEDMKYICKEINDCLK